jgi:hypothetical protein
VKKIWAASMNPSSRPNACSMPTRTYTRRLTVSHVRTANTMITARVASRLDDHMVGR